MDQGICAAETRSQQSLSTATPSRGLSGATTQADCEKAGGVWDADNNKCSAKEM